MNNLNNIVGDLNPSIPKILFIEDSPLIQHMYSSLLKHNGFDHDLATDEKEAVELFFNNSYNLIVLDIGLSDMYSVEVVRKIRASIRNPHIPIIALVDFKFLVNYDCLNAAVDEILFKPIFTKNLIAALLKWLYIKINKTILMSDLYISNS